MTDWIYIWICTMAKLAKKYSQRFLYSASLAPVCKPYTSQLMAYMPVLHSHAGAWEREMVD